MSLIGKTIGNYQVTKLLGEGGMGAVYLAEHPVIGKKVALKVVHLEMAKDPEIVARFFNEARAIHMIGHENIVDVLDFGQTPDGYPYFIMEYLPGQALADRVAAGPIEPGTVAKIAAQICNALQAAHEKGIIHRDLKPQNVFLLPEIAGEPHVKILDFGVAKIAQGADSPHSVKTRAGSLMGTPLYMSPEQCKGAGTIDHRTDIYALGIMVYEMITGRPPFVSEGVGELFARHMMETPRPIGEVAPQTPAHMAAAVARSLAKKAEDRFPTMNDFRSALLAEVAPSHAAAATIMGAPGFQRPPAKSTPGAIPHPQHTTLSSAVAEMGDEPRPARRKAALIGGGIAAAAVVVVLVGAMGGIRSGGDKPSAASAAGAPATEVVAPAPGQRAVTIVLDASPKGAHVFRKTDNRDLGEVPVTLPLPADGGKPEFVFRLAGHVDQTLPVELTHDQRLDVTLAKAPVAAAKRTETKAETEASSGTSSSRSRSGRSKSASGKNVVVSDDDLATPSF